MFATANDLNMPIILTNKRYYGKAQITEVEGGWDWTEAWGGAAAGACLGPEGMLVGFVVGGLLY